jgi:predicted alpha-1,2-mannosidase
MELSRPVDEIQLYQGNDLVNSQDVRNKRTRLKLNFKTREGEQLLIKVALSSASVEGARKNMTAELPGWDFSGVVAQTSGAWDQLLSLVQIEGTDYQKEVFYTNLYHCFLTPSLHSDVDGGYKGADGQNHQAIGYNRYDTFSLWDTYRAAHPLYTILCPDRVSDMVASFLAHYNETGLLPVWSMVGNETNMMIGYHAVPVIVDAYFKGIPMDAEQAFEACVASANDTGRHIGLYRRMGYVPALEGEEWSLSKTLEYAYDDWCIAQLAKALGKDDHYKEFSRRAGFWKNHFDPQTGFLRPKDVKGKFLPGFNAKHYGKEYCESNAWHYFWSVQHDF